MSQIPDASGEGGSPRRHSEATLGDAVSTASSNSTPLPHWENEPRPPVSLRNDATADQQDAARTFETEFLNHRQAVKSGNMDKAIQSFIMLQTSSGQNEEFQRYLVDVANEIDPGRDSELSQFFASLPALIQSTIVENAAAYLEEKDILRAFQVLFDYIQAYPRHAYKYLIRAIDLLILCARSLEGKEPEHSEKCIKMLVTELLQRLWKQRILLTRRDRQPTVKSTDSKHHIVIPYNLFEQYLIIGQRYYIGQRDWNELVKFTCAMLDCCGYSGLTRLDFLSHTNRFQYMKEQRGNIRIDVDDCVSTAEEGGSGGENADDLRILVAFMCESMAAASQMVQFGNDYYKAVCADDDGKDEKSCLIPICAMQPSFSSAKVGRQDTPSDKDAAEKSSPTDDSATEDNSRKRKGTERDAEELNSEQQGDPEHRTKKLKLDDMPDRGKGLDSYCMRGVDEALQTLSKAADCMRHMVDLWQWATLVAPKTNWVNVFGSWEQELCRVIEEYKLPFDIYNAVLLVRSDLALSSPSVPGNLAKALKLSQNICDRIEIQRRRESREAGRASEYDIPFMFAFRVLYNIGVIYLLVGSIQQSTLEIAIILSVFPIPEGLDEKDFIADEIDCHTIASVFQGHEFGLMRVTQEGLVVRCMKHLIVSLNSESEQRGGMASIDSAMRWDEKAGNMIVLMQYGWPYWRERTNFWHKITQRMKEKRVFKNREFLEYVYVPEILQTIQMLHETDTVTLDIIPPEFALRSSYRNLAISSASSASPSIPSSPQPSSAASPSTAAASDSSQTGGSDISHKNSQDDGKQLPSLGTLPLTTTGSSPQHKQTAPPPPPPPIYQPSFTNTILPSMSMSPSWYSPSHQKNTHANWMSPSFYYSRPATSVMLPKKEQFSADGNKDRNGAEMSVEQLQRSFVPKDIVTRCLEYRVRRYSPKMTPQRMRHVLQKFLKNMVLKANEDL